MIRQFLSNATVSTPSPFEKERTPESIAMHRQNIIVNAVENLEVFELKPEVTSSTSVENNKLTYSQQPANSTQQALNNSATKAGEVVVLSEQNYDRDSIEAVRSNIAQNAVPADIQRQTFTNSEGSVG